MNLYEAHKKLDKINTLIAKGEFKAARDNLWLTWESIYKFANIGSKKKTSHITLLLKVSAHLIDAGHLCHDIKLVEAGVDILERHQEDFLVEIDNDIFYYNLANGHNSLLVQPRQFECSFENIEKLVSIKNHYWKALKSQQPSKTPPEYMVNLANSLKRQHRVAEAISYYKEVNKKYSHIPQAHVNYGEALLQLNRISNTGSDEMLRQIVRSYETASKHPNTPIQWKDYYRSAAQFIYQQALSSRNECHIIDKENDELTSAEFSSLSSLRKFCLQNDLTLSEHGIYCPCLASAHDDLVITTTTGLTGDFIPAMELALNRIKSEYALARKLYFEYTQNAHAPDTENDYYYTELGDNEMIGIDSEKLRTAFRLCFGILDKIGVAICELYDVYPGNQQISFQSFWQLDKDERRKKFEEFKTPGLLALYSIATDLNAKKSGEWSFYKEWRNSLEHKFLVIQKSQKQSQPYSNHRFFKSVMYVNETEFIQHLKRMLHLTRSAIFSFAFAVRESGRPDSSQGPFTYYELSPKTGI